MNIEISSKLNFCYFVDNLGLIPIVIHNSPLLFYNTPLFKNCKMPKFFTNKEKVKARNKKSAF